jgi:hypothetical protein
MFLCIIVNLQCHQALHRKRHIVHTMLVAVFSHTVTEIDGSIDLFTVGRTRSPPSCRTRKRPGVAGRRSIQNEEAARARRDRRVLESSGRGVPHSLRSALAISRRKGSQRRQGSPPASTRRALPEFPSCTAAALRACACLPLSPHRQFLSRRALRLWFCECRELGAFVFVCRCRQTGAGTQRRDAVWWPSGNPCAPRFASTHARTLTKARVAPAAGIPSVPEAGVGAHQLISRLLWGILYSTSCGSAPDTTRKYRIRGCNCWSLGVNKCHAQPVSQSPDLIKDDHQNLGKPKSHAYSTGRQCTLWTCSCKAANAVPRALVFCMALLEKSERFCSHQTCRYTLYSYYYYRECLKIASINHGNQSA